MSWIELSNILYPPSQLSWRSPPSLLLEREINRYDFSKKRPFYSPGFTPDTIRSLTRSFSFTHLGCVNTANYNLEGTLLLTGSDDRDIKVWKSSNFIDPSSIKCAHHIATEHSSNIFHVLVRIFLSF